MPGVGYPAITSDDNTSGHINLFTTDKQHLATADLKRVSATAHAPGATTTPAEI